MSTPVTTTDPTTTKPSKTARSLYRDQRGAGLVEYIILVGVIAIFCITAFGQFGTAVKDKVDVYKTKVGNLPTGG